MTLLYVVTLVCVGLLAGVELAVSLVVNPVLERQELLVEARLVQTFARQLGRAMPVWYGLSLLLLVAATILGRNTAGFAFLVAASVIWTLVIVLTLLFLVPANNRLARLDPRAWSEATRRLHRTWDRRHRARIAALVAALVCFILAPLV